MTTVRDFYEGGMILFDINAAYEYEEWLADILKKRLEKWRSGSWNFYFLMLDEFDKREKAGWYNESAFHILPGDPLVYIPDVPKMLLLKSRHLHNLRLKALKKLRQSQRAPLKLTTKQRIAKITREIKELDWEL